MRDPRSTPVACLLCRKELHVALFSLVLSDIDDDLLEEHHECLVKGVNSFSLEVLEE